MVPRMASRMGFCGSLPSCSANCPSVSRFSGTTCADPRLLHQGVPTGLLGKPSLLDWLRQLPQRRPLLRHHQRKRFSRILRKSGLSRPSCSASCCSVNRFSSTTCNNLKSGLAPMKTLLSCRRCRGCSGADAWPRHHVFPLFGMATAGRMPFGAEQGSLAVLGGHADASAVVTNKTRRCSRQRVPHLGHDGVTKFDGDLTFRISSCRATCTQDHRIPLSRGFEPD